MSSTANMVTPAAAPWRPSPRAPRVYVKDLGMANGWVMQLVRYDAGGVAPIEGASAGAFVYVVHGELIYCGRRLWPGATAIVPPGAADDARSDSGCTLLCVHPAEQPPEGENLQTPSR